MSAFFALIFVKWHELCWSDTSFDFAQDKLVRRSRDSVLILAFDLLQQCRCVEDTPLRVISSCVLGERLLCSGRAAIHGGVQIVKALYSALKRRPCTQCKALACFRRQSPHHADKSVRDPRALTYTSLDLRECYTPPDASG